MALRGTDPESYITEYTLVYEDSNSSGQADADLIIYVSGAASGPCVTHGALAYAQACQADQLVSEKICIFN